MRLTTALTTSGGEDVRRDNALASAAALAPSGETQTLSPLPGDPIDPVLIRALSVVLSNDGAQAGIEPATGAD